MKVAVPVDSPSPQSDVSDTLGRTGHFLIYDTVRDVIEFMPNTAAATPSGTGIAAAQLLVDAGVSVLLTPRCGERAAAVLSAAGIEVYQVNRTNAQKALADWEHRALPVLISARPGGRSGEQS